ncbi:hypothetical protein ATO8_08086 [Roseivivax marinus]|uniref:Probable membrane transporter protein n=1 Tax=Roseivivax marinus TaxID=1379903 RepID=W4HMD3_9RHOB|nr:sulfite exporter TauE/SafE family protein [Roseivivax marinus]ETW13155.1 hypothetical protein ATO8_08086 [Roseivivax marinus]
MSGLSPSELILIAGILAVMSVVAGILAGLLGVGGGIVLVPVLFWILSLTDFPSEIAMHMAVATSLATICFTSVSSARAHHKRGAVDKGLLRLWGPWIAAGALLGGLASRLFEADGLKAVFGGLALLVAINMAVPKTLVISEAMPRSRAVNAGLSLVTGFLSALMGIGGGTLSVPLLSAFSVKTRRAVGTAAAFGFLIAVPAVIGFVVAGWNVPDRPPLSLGYVNLVAAAIILPFTVGFAPLGSRLAHAVDTKLLRRLFALFLAITAVRMLLEVLG